MLITDVIIYNFNLHDLEILSLWAKDWLMSFILRG